jgi:hypothetical protein
MEPWLMLLQFILTYALFGWNFYNLSISFQALLISTSVSKFSKAVNLFKISTWYCSLPSTSFNLLRLNLSAWNLPVDYLLTTSLSLNLPPPDSGQYHNLLPWRVGQQVYWMPSPVYQNMVNLVSVRFLDVAKFTTVTPLSLLISCKLSFGH